MEKNLTEALLAHPCPALWATSNVASTSGAAIGTISTVGHRIRNGGSCLAGLSTVEDVRRCVAATRAERNAKLWYFPCFSRPFKRPALISKLMRADTPKWDWIRHGLASQGPAGAIDFTRDRSLYMKGSRYWLLFVDGTGWRGAPGNWMLDERNFPLIEEEPHWLLSVLDAATDVVFIESRETSTGTWLYAKAACSLEAARSTTGREVMLPMAVYDIDKSEFPPIEIDVWVDELGRIRRAVWSRGITLTELELSDFGTASRVEVPATWTEPDDG